MKDINIVHKLPGYIFALLSLGFRIHVHRGVLSLWAFTVFARVQWYDAEISS